MNNYQNGAGCTLGHWLATSAPLYMSGNIWFVHADTGADNDDPAGQHKLEPLATLEKAIDNASDHDLIVLLDGHEETLTGPLTINKRVMIVGGGMSAGYPTVKFTPNIAGNDNLFVVSVTNVLLGNIYFEENLQANTDPRILVSQGGFRMEGCHMDCGQYDQGPGVSLANSESSLANYFRDCTFVSTASAIDEQPDCAVKTAGPGTYTCLDFEGCTFDGGSYGFSNYKALDLDESAITRIILKQCAFLRSASLSNHEDTVGIANATTFSGGGMVRW